MTSLTQLFVATVAVAGLLALIGVSAPRRLLIKGAALAAATVFLPLAYASLVDLLSRPKPIDLEWWLDQAEEASVLGSRIRENESIHLWLQLPGAAEPRAYVLPWNRDMAEHLQKAKRDADRHGGDLRMRLPFESGLDDRAPRFYAVPQPAPPPKDLTGAAPRFYSPPDRGA